MTNNKEQVIAKVAEVLHKNKEDIYGGSNFDTDLGADSLDMVEVCINIEEEFQISIPDSVFEKEVRTINDLVRVVDQIESKK